MQNRAIEFHDSHVVSIHREGSNVRLRLQAYVHASDGQPGYDAGTGWTQAVELVIEKAELEGELPDEAWLTDGGLSVEGADAEELVPLPFHAVGSVHLVLEGGGGKLSITGRGVTVTATGEATFIEGVD